MTSTQESQSAKANPFINATSTSTNTDANTDANMLPETKKRVPFASPPASPKKKKKSKTSSKHTTRSKNPLMPLQPGRRVRHILAPQPRGDIRTFKDALQLFSVTKDAFEGLVALKEEAGIIHGTVAARHIIINRDGSGTLIDWDMPGLEDFPPRRA
ncbi:hypothetical protein A7U60_g1496 [Sanghuangporus baumii]|uniref:Fungal-type protein kinase domain-containing protein n=1 Tax=Sanghuangporus baumii TaxID=108892 RepID=A0A9Q5I4H8_SANBA|nr:hypothetical protein A7U60_g1496 [Sanghuangporus baumii]